MTERLQKYDNKRHQRFNQTKLQGGLLAEPQKSDGVSFALQTTGAVHATGPDWFAPDFRHDVALAPQVLVAQGQEIVDNKGCK